MTEEIGSELLVSGSSIRRKQTFVNLLEFTDDVQPDIGEFILQQVQEELKKMIDGGTMTKERCKPSNLVCKGSPDMLRAVLTEVPNKRYYPGNDDLGFQQFRKTFRESRSKTPH
jgi:hypothetical protein